MKYEDYNGGFPPNHPLNRGTLVRSLGQGQTESAPPESLETIEEEVIEKDNNPDDSETK